MLDLHDGFASHLLAQERVSQPGDIPLTEPPFRRILSSGALKLK